MNAPDVYRPEPLTWRDLPDTLTLWAESLRSDRFWVMMLDNVKASARVRDAAAKAVVWLEMKCQSELARRLDDAVQAMREAVFACQKPIFLCGPSHAEHGPKVQALRNAWAASVENLRAAIEQVIADVPPETWEGIDG